MGITNVKVTVGNPADPRRSTEVECLVDSGATYSLVPAEIRTTFKPQQVLQFDLQVSNDGDTPIPMRASVMDSDVSRVNSASA